MLLNMTIEETEKKTRDIEISLDDVEYSKRNMCPFGKDCDVGGFLCQKCLHHGFINCDKNGTYWVVVCIHPDIAVQKEKETALIEERADSAKLDYVHSELMELMNDGVIGDNEYAAKIIEIVEGYKPKELG